MYLLRILYVIKSYIISIQYKYFTVSLFPLVINFNSSCLNKIDY